MKTQTIEELKSEIKDEAENNIEEAVRTRRTITTYVSLFALSVLLTILIFGWHTETLNVNGGLIMIFFLIIFAIVVMTDLPLRLSNLIPVRRTKKFLRAVDKEFDDLLEKKIQTCAEDIEGEKNFITETGDNLKQYQLECEENIREAENMIDELEARQALFQQIKSKTTATKL